MIFLFAQYLTNDKLKEFQMDLVCYMQEEIKEKLKKETKKFKDRRQDVIHSMIYENSTRSPAREIKMSSSIRYYTSTLCCLRL